MGKKLGLASLLYRMRETASTRPYHSLSPPPAWPWPSCGHPKTSSFRKDITQVIEDDSDEGQIDMKPRYFQCTSGDSFHSNSSPGHSGCVPNAEDDTVEAIIRGLRSERLFFEPGSTSSIVNEATSKRARDEISFEGSIAMAMDSEDPYRDFKVSMEEMVMAHGVKNWEWLEEMLIWYLRANGKSSHVVIVGAFLDLLMSIASTSSTSLSCSSFCSSCTTFEIEEDEIAG